MLHTNVRVCCCQVHGLKHDLEVATAVSSTNRSMLSTQKELFTLKQDERIQESMKTTIKTQNRQLNLQTDQVYMYYACVYVPTTASASSSTTT